MRGDGVRRGAARQAAMFAAVISLGLLSRSHRIGLSPFLAKYGGDALWAWMVFLLAGLLFPRLSSLRIAVAAMLYSCATEFSQLYHAPWIDAIRRTTPGHLVLGDTFAWADIIAYLVGIAIGYCVERGLFALARRHGGSS